MRESPPQPETSLIICAARGDRRVRYFDFAVSPLKWEFSHNRASLPIPAKRAPVPWRRVRRRAVRVDSRPNVKQIRPPLVLSNACSTQPRIKKLPHRKNYPIRLDVEHPITMCGDLAQSARRKFQQEGGGGLSWTILTV